MKKALIDKNLKEFWEVQEYGHQIQIFAEQGAENEVFVQEKRHFVLKIGITILE